LPPTPPPESLRLASRTSAPGSHRVDAWTAKGWHWEQERTTGGARQLVLTIFLTGAKCPFRCVFCDLAAGMLDTPTPPGAIPAQIARVLTEVGPIPNGAAVKLYNGSNFFDPRAVPTEDEDSILELLNPFARVIVESHPRLIGERCDELAKRLGGRLEVAMGLETAHPEALARLGKAMSLADFDRAAARLTSAGAALRVFLLVPPPFVKRAAVPSWTGRSAAYAHSRGTVHLTLIPTRTEPGDPLVTRGELTHPDLGLLEDALEQAAAVSDRTVVAVDLWDIERLAGCTHCTPDRVARLRAFNLTGHAAPRVECAVCASPS